MRNKIKMKEKVAQTKIVLGAASDKLHCFDL
jgi:hypothetical protein